MVALGTDIRMIREGSGAPLVLLHCLGVDHRFWDFAKPLSARRTLWRYDLPGHGETPVPAHAYSVEDLSAQLEALMRREGIARADIAGISLGGLIAQHFAAAYPDKVSKLVLVDTTPRYSDDLRAMWAERAATARTDGVAALTEGLLQIWFSADAIRADIEGVRYVRDTLRRASGEGYALACEALAAADLRDLAGSIRAPTLVVCGDNDIPSFIEAARWLAGHIPDSRAAWIEGTRHASVLEKPAEALKLLTGFLAAA